MSNGFIYLGQPYSHPDAAVRDHRFNAGCIKAASLMRQGYTVFSPIAHSHPIAAHLAPELLMNHAHWMKQDLPILSWADKLIVLTLDGWQQSRGLNQEMCFAYEREIDIEFHDMDGIWFPEEGDTALDYLHTWKAEGTRAN